MKAIQYTAYGDSGVLKLNDINKPQAKDDEVLVKAEATTVNPLEVKIRSGSMQKMMPVELPYVPGSDVSGTVEAVGNNVTRFKEGDKIVATTSGGAYAEYVAVKEELAALKPESVSFNEAVALAVPINTAATLLNENAQLQKGQTILIHGAAGAVGSVMVQMAKMLGAHVTATASGDGVYKLKALGADVVIDYKKQDFTTLVKDMDVVADLVGGETQAKSFSVLKKGGKLLSIVMPPSTELAEKHSVTAQFVFSKPSYTKLEAGLKLAEAGKLNAGIAKVMKLQDAAQAQDLVSSGGINGKVILEMR